MNQTLRTILCRTRLWHDWRTMSNPDGQRYRACSVCGKDQGRSVTGSNIVPGGG